MMRVIHLKLGAENRAHAVAVCFRNGWLSGNGNGGPGSAGPPGRESVFDEPGAQVGKLYGLRAPRRRDGPGAVQSSKFRPGRCKGMRPGAATGDPFHQREIYRAVMMDAVLIRGRMPQSRTRQWTADER